MTIECIKYIPLNKKGCLGFAEIYVPAWGLNIRGISLHQKDGKRWVNFPSKSYEKDGETRYASYFYFKDKSLYSKFCIAVKDAIETKAQDEMKPSTFDNEIDDSECPF